MICNIVISYLSQLTISILSTVCEFTHFHEYLNIQFCCSVVWLLSGGAVVISPFIKSNATLTKIGNITARTCSNRWPFRHSHVRPSIIGTGGNATRWNCAFILHKRRKKQCCLLFINFGKKLAKNY